MIVDPDIVAEVLVAGHDYDDLVAKANDRAVDLLGPDRDYRLELNGVEPIGQAADGKVSVWQGIARIVAPVPPDDAF